MVHGAKLCLTLVNTCSPLKQHLLSPAEPDLQPAINGTQLNFITYHYYKAKAFAERGTNVGWVYFGVLEYTVCGVYVLYVPQC